ncbi:GNAT family N-acetyltransferase [Arthrobacter pigmenti]
MIDLPLRTERLVLRPYQLNDVDATFAYYSHASVSRFLLSEPFTWEDACQAVEKRSQLVHPVMPGETLALVVEHDGQLVGDVMLELLAEQASIGEIGWVFNPSHGGRGLATEAVRALVGVAFERFGLHRVKAQLDARNTDSARLCERLGMIREAHLRQDWWSKGEWSDTLIYGLLTEEWRTAANAAGARNESRTTTHRTGQSLRTPSAQGPPGHPPDHRR